MLSVPALHSVRCLPWVPFPVRLSTSGGAVLNGRIRWHDGIKLTHVHARNQSYSAICTTCTSLICSLCEMNLLYMLLTPLIHVGRNPGKCFHPLNSLDLDHVHISPIEATCSCGRRSFLFDFFQLFPALTLTLTLTPNPQRRHTTPSDTGDAEVSRGKVCACRPEIDAACADFDENTLWARWVRC